MDIIPLSDIWSENIFSHFIIYLFIWLRQFGCGMRDLVPWPGIETGPAAMKLKGACSLE